MDKILENSMWFQENHKELYAKYPDKYLVIVDKKIVKIFDTLDCVVKFSIDEYGENSEIYTIAHCTNINYRCPLIDYNIYKYGNYM